MRTKRNARPRERGAALATVGIFMIVLAGMAVLGVDVGRLAYTATETQVVADAGAVAYAKTMLDNDVNDTNDSPFVAADQVVGDNRIDGRSASQAKVEYAVGKFDFDSREFRPGDRNGDGRQHLRRNVRHRQLVGRASRGGGLRGRR
jgi:Putative Flp pilus-assembly TadE/G-like